MEQMPMKNYGKCIFILKFPSTVFLHYFITCRPDRKGLNSRYKNFWLVKQKVMDENETFKKVENLLAQKYSKYCLGNNKHT